MTTFTPDEVFNAINFPCKIINRENQFVIDNASSLENCNENSLVWVSEAMLDKEANINNLKANLVITTNQINDKLINNFKTVICVEDPRLAFLRLSSILFIKKIEPGIHETAYIHPEAKIANNVYVGPFCYIGKSSIGEGTIIYGSCHIYDKVTIGKNVLIHAGTVIGADGFGYQKNENGHLEKFPHFGGVVIEDEVEIGSNTSIDKGSLGNTLIKKNAKIDNLVHIAHNVIVGENATVIANSMVGGSTIIGDNAWIAPSATLRDRIVIGKGAVAGMASVITKNIPDGETWLGSPAKELSVYLKNK